MELGIAQFRNLTVRFGFALGGPRALLKQTHLAKKVVFVQIRDDDLAARFVLDEDGDRAFGDVVDRIAMFAGLDNRRAPWIAPAMRSRQELIDVRDFGGLKVQANHDSGWYGWLICAGTAFCAP